MESRKDRQSDPLEPLDLSRRKVVKVALAASAVAVPVISSVALGGVSPAFAESPNISGQTTTTKPAGTTAQPGETTAQATDTTAAPGTTTTAPETTAATTTTASPEATTTTTTTTVVSPTPPEM